MSDLTPAEKAARETGEDGLNLKGVQGQYVTCQKCGNKRQGMVVWTCCGEGKDLLALEAENKRLRAALKDIIDAQDIECVCDETESTYPGCGHCDRCMSASDVLRAPAPDTSGFWKVLAEADRWVSAGAKEGDNSANAIAGYCFLREGAKAFTPAQRALIQEMAGRVQG